MLCHNRLEGFGPLSHLYSHILTSCFIDTILIPLATWLYLLTLILLLSIPSRRSNHNTHNSRSYRRPGLFRKKSSKDSSNLEYADSNVATKRTRSKTHLVLAIIYYLLLLAQICMCVLEITRLSLAHLGIGLLPFTFVSLILAAILRFTSGMNGRIRGWRWANLGLWVILAGVNGVKIAEEVKEGMGMRKGSKYPEADEVTDVAVMVGVYVVLAVLEGLLGSEQ